MRKIKCEFYCVYVTERERWLEEINQTLARSGFSDIRLEMPKDGQIADISFVDSVFKIREAQGIVLFSVANRLYTTRC